MEEVRRTSDGELCGYVAHQDGRWHALAVFGAVLGIHDSQAAAKQFVGDNGLALLAERWTLRSRDGNEEVVCVIEANTTSVTVARGYYSMPGVLVLTISAAELAAGTWAMHPITNG